MIFILIAIAMQSALQPNMYRSGWKIYISAIVLPLIGYALGFIVSKIFCQTYRVARTVGFETGVQNLGLAISLVLLAYSPVMASQMLICLTLIGIGSIVSALLVIAAFKIYNKIVVKREPEQIYTLCNS